MVLFLLEDHLVGNRFELVCVFFFKLVFVSFNTFHIVILLGIMAISDADRLKFETHLASEVDADLVFIMADSGIALNHQYDISLLYTTLRKFAMIADTRKEVRDICKSDFQMDQAASAAMRSQVASVLPGWAVPYTNPNPPTNYNV